MNFPRRILVLLTVIMACEGGRRQGGATTAVQRAIVDLEIGEIDGDDPYLFGGVSGVTMDGLGQIYVADVQADEVRAFRADGSFAYRVAGRGAGPGEVQSPCCLAFDRHGMLWVRDTQNARYNGYTVGAQGAVYARSVRMQHTSPGYWVAPSFDAAGYLIDVGHVQGTLTRFHLTADSDVATTDVIDAPPSDSLGQYEVEREIRGNRVIAYVHQPYGPQYLIAHSPGGGWAEAISSRYSVAWMVLGGEITIRGKREGPALSVRERTAADSALQVELKRWNVRPGELSIEIPDRKPPLVGLKFTEGDRLWVFLSPSDSGPQQADVFNRTGERETTIEWPADVDLRYGFVSDTVALGIRRDNLGVQYVVRMRIDGRL